MSDRFGSLNSISDSASTKPRPTLAERVDELTKQVTAANEALERQADEMRNMMERIATLERETGVGPHVHVAEMRR